MAKNGIDRVFSRIIKFKSGELKISFLLFFYLFLVIAAYNVIKPIRNASFLEELGYQKLPLVYLLTAVIIGFVVAFHSKIQVRISRHSLITFSIIFFLISCFVFRFLSGYGWVELPVIFWVWANIFIIVLNTQFWITVNDILNPREFKRLSGFFISGGILGGFMGGVLAGLLAKENVDYNLLYLSAGLLALCALFVYLIFRRQRGEQPFQAKKENREEDSPETTAKPGFRDCFHTVKRHKYLRLIAAIVILTLVVSTLVDFQWNTVVNENKREGLTSFFGYFNAGLMVFAFFLSILMTSNLYKRYGVRLSLLLYPLVLMLCFSGIGIAAVLVMAIVIKGSDKSLAYTINRSARELLFIPVSPDLKYKAIVFINMFVDRFAKGIGAVVLMIVLSFGIQDYKEIIRIVSLISIVLILGWVVLTLKASREYVNSVKQKLPAPEKRADQVVEETLDVEYTKLIFDTLESKERSPDLYAMHIFDLMKQGKLTPELWQLLSGRSEEAVSSAFGAFFEADRTALIQVDKEFSDKDFLKKEVQDIMALDVYENVIKDYMETVLSGKTKDAETAKIEIAKGIGFLASDSPITEKLGQLLEDESAEVRKYAIDSASKLRKREHVPALIKGLSDSATRGDASAALEKHGIKITGILADHLGDPGEDIGLRKTVAAILGHIGNQDASDFLMWELAEGKKEMDMELIDALDRIRSEKPEIEFSHKTVKEKISQEIKSHYRLFIDCYTAESEGKESEICRDLSHDLKRSLMNIFRLLGLIYPHEDIVKAFQNIQKGTRDSIAYAVELLDNTLEKGLKEAFLPLVEDLTHMERVKACKTLQSNFPEF